MVDRSTFWACAGVAAASDEHAVTMALRIFTVLTLSGRTLGATLPSAEPRQKHSAPQY